MLWPSSSGRWARGAGRRSGTGPSRALGRHGGAVGGGQRCSGGPLASPQAITGPSRWPPRSRACPTPGAAGRRRASRRWMCVRLGGALSGHPGASRPLGPRLHPPCRPVVLRSMPARRACAAGRPPPERVSTRAPRGGADRVVSAKRSRRGPRAKACWGRWPPWGGRGRWRAGRGHAPRRAETSRAARGSGLACRPPVCGVSALGNGVRWPPGRLWRGPRPGPGRHGRGPGRQRRPGPPGAPGGARRGRRGRAPGEGAPRTAGPRGWRPRAMRWSGPARRRTAEGHGAPGCGAGAPPCLPPTRPRGWQNGGAMRSPPGWP